MSKKIVFAIALMLCVSACDYVENYTEDHELSELRSDAELAIVALNRSPQEFIANHALIRDASFNAENIDWHSNGLDPKPRIATYEEFKKKVIARPENKGVADAEIYGVWLEEYGNKKFEWEDKAKKAFTPFEQLNFALTRVVELQPEWHENKSLAKFNSELFDRPITFVKHGGVWLMLVE